MHVLQSFFLAVIFSTHLIAEIPSAQQSKIGQPHPIIYMKTGFTEQCPTLGLGTRVYQGNHRMDLSMQMATFLFFPGYFSCKGLYLYAPTHLYFGGGGGIAVAQKKKHMSAGGGYSPYVCEGCFEECIGYEWDNTLFIQIELSEPFAFMSSERLALMPSSMIRPALMVGIGF